MTLSLPRFRSLTDLPSPTYLEDWRVSLIRPITRTNLVTNPSGETATTGYTAAGGSIARSTTESYHGAYSIAVTPTAGTTDGVFYGTVSLTSGTTYAASVKIKVPNAAGRKYRIAFATTGAAMLQTTEFYATGHWQWVSVIYTETSSTTRRIYVSKSGGTETAVFYIDGLQVEACESGNQFATTYIDGDQRGLLGDLESSPAYYWTGTPHASTSVRSGQTRAGGQVVKLQNYGFFLTAIIGLGMAPVIPITTAFGQLDGSQYLDQRLDSRQIILNGRWAASTARQQDRQMAQLSADLARDYIATRQPMTLLFEPMVDNKPIRAPIAAPGVSYIGGLEGNVDGLPVADTPISFTQYLPVISGGEDGVALDVQDTFTPTGFITRSPAGVWSRVGSGVTGGAGSVLAMVRAQDGTIYLGGNFTDAGGSGADFIASYNPATGTFAALGSVTAINGTVNALAIGPNGLLYVGGFFTNAGGIAAADFIATWDGSTWAALSTGMNSTVNAIVISPTGVVYAGGDFTTAGGGAAVRVASWDGATWSALGTGANAQVLALLWANNKLYIGGSFTDGGGVAAADYIGSWDGSAWGALGVGANQRVNTLALGPNGTVYASGIFTTIGGITAGGVAAWNGVSWRQLGQGFSSPGSDYALGMAVSPTNILYLAANSGVIDPGTPNIFFLWNGTSYVTAGIVLSATTGASVLLVPDGTLYVGLGGAGTVTAASGFASVVNSGSAATYPKVVITGPSSGTARLYEMVNQTTGKAIYFNYIISAGETVTLIVDPVRISMSSTFNGNILSGILPGSDVGNFALQPGTNSISFVSQSSTVAAVMSWPVTLDTLTDGWTK